MLQFAYILFKKIFFGRVTERDQQLLFDGLYSPQVAASARAAKSFVQPPRQVAGAAALAPSSSAFPGPLARSWIGRGQPRL